jgi:hypothetical protein
MSKQFRPLMAFFILTIVILACTVPIPQIPPAGQPTQGGGTAMPPGSPNMEDIGTVVALTLTAFVPGPIGSTATVATVPTVASPGEPTSLLPHTLYFLAPDSAGLNQVYRIEPDGITRFQMTSESVNVNDYDVSPVDGSVAYVADNKLLHVNAGGSERRVLLNGGDVDPNNPFMSTISSPVFSLDAQTLAYGYKGLRFYSFSSDESRLVLQNLVDDAGSGILVPRELYEPERYSPDGTKLLINLSYYEGGSSAIYDPATNALVRLNGGEGALIWADNNEWSADSSSIYSASPSMGMFNSGLWRVDAATGAVTTLIPADAGGGNYNTADEAFLAPDGQLYFFFATVPSPEGIITRSPLQLVRAAPDGVTGRTVLSEEDLQLLNEALWAPDASFVVAAFAPTQEVYQGGQAEIVYLDGRPNVVLAPFALQMKWGP